jgi:predicted permease
VAGLVLLIASVNIGSLFIARATARRQELSVRLAIGAPRWRLARQLFVEGLMLATTSAVAGTLIAVWASRALVAHLPAAGAPVVVDLPIDWRVLTFTIGVTVATVVLFATAPALYAMRVPSLEAVQEAGRGGSGRRTGLLSSGVIVIQVALSLVLLAAAGVFARTLERLADVPLGFDPQGVLVITVNATRSDVDSAARLRLYDRIIEAVAAVPGVTRAAGSIWTPVGAGGGGLLTDARGRRAEFGRQVAFNFVTPGWFATYGTAFQTGRDFDARDGTTAARVAIVNEMLYRSLLHDLGAEASTIEAGPCRRGGCTVVGVVADAVYGRSLRDPSPPTVYVPLAQSGGLGPPHAVVRVSVRTSGDGAHLIGALREALRGVEPGLTFAFRPLDAEIEASVAQERLLAVLAGLFGAIGLLLSAVGLYGVTWYAASRRRGEIGIRLALGAQPSAVLRVMLTRIALFVAIGTVVGVFASLWLSRFVAPLLYGVEPRDPVTLAGSAATLASVAALATWLPAWRATRIDPARGLREH